MNTEDLQQHSFAIVSQLLEFWERNYLISKEDLALISAQQSAQGSRATGSGSNTNTTTNTNKPKEEETEVKVNEIPNVIPRKVGPKLKFGVQLPADKKPDGSWCYYTNQRDINVEKQSILYQTIFSRPTKDCPVPRATSTVWFELTKRLRWNLEFRFEHQNQTHSLSFGEMVPFAGFNIREEGEIKELASLIAKPLKRLSEIIEAKCQPISVQ